MLLQRMAVGIYGANCYIIGSENTMEAAVIDPGGDAEKIFNFLQDNEMKCKYIILTHGHGDHVGGLKELKKLTDAPIYMHKADSYLLQDKNKNYSAVMGGKAIEMNADVFIGDGEELELGELKLKIIHTPGHTPGSICIYVNNVVFTGDTLFANSIGRTDLEGGDYNLIIPSIKEKLMVLDEDTTVFPGHGPASRIGIEKATNSFIK